MGKRLRVLNVEDSEQDRALLARHLERAGYDLSLDRVDTAESMKAALATREWDVILCDYSMPEFNALAALALLKEMRRDIPFIIISGTVGEAVAVEAMRLGAHDYLMKDNLVRLGPTIERELQESENRCARLRAEAELLASERKYRLLFDQNPLPMWVFDRETLEFLAVNEAAIAHYGFSREEFLTMTIEDIRPPEELPKLRQVLSQSVSELSRAGIWKHRKKDRTLLHVEITSHAIDFDGRAAEMVLANDVTERVLTQEQLHLQSAALESAANGIVITDTNGKIIWVNQAFTQSSGYSLEEVLGRNPRLLRSGKQDKIFYQKMWSTILSGEVWRNTIINRRKDGTCYHEDLTITPIRNADGSITRFVGIQHDITERKLAEEAQKASELRYRRLFESAKDGILILDADTGRIVDANPYIAETLGYSHEDLVGKELWQIGVFRDISAAKESFEELRDKGYVRYEDLPLETLNGVTIEVEFVSNVYLVGDSRVMQCNIRDITQRKRAERVVEETNRKLEATLGELSATTQQLWQASKLATMGELSASIAHELNNPLATVALRVESLLMMLPEDEQKRQSLEIIMQEVDRMATLVNNLLQFSRRSHRQESTVDLREEIANSVEFVHYHLRTRKIEVVREFADSLPTIQADRQQLRQLFLNLLTNAGDAMPEGGRLIARAEPTQLDGAEAVAIEFVDTGEGIAAENLEKIWEPFFTTKREGKGTGLGLAICRRIVEEHGGTIDIESQPGGGTTVRMVFPATSNGSLANLQ
jgi:nitrogen fixation negative regulator NifL